MATPNESKRIASSLLEGVKTVSQVGWAKVAGGAAIYAAHIRQVDRGQHRHRGRAPERNFKREHLGRDL